MCAASLPVEVQSIPVANRTGPHRTFFNKISIQSR